MDIEGIVRVTRQKESLFGGGGRRLEATLQNVKRPEAEVSISGNMQFQGDKGAMPELEVGECYTLRLEAVPNVPEEEVPGEELVLTIRFRNDELLEETARILQRDLTDKEKAMVRAGIQSATEVMAQPGSDQRRAMTTMLASGVAVNLGMPQTSFAPPESPPMPEPDEPA